MKRACVAAMLVASVAIVPMSPVADAVSLRWVDQLDGIYVEATAIDASGNVYVVGTKHRATQYRSHFAYLAKYGPLGRKIWSRTWDPRGAVSGSSATEVAIGDDGSVYWAGVASGMCEGGGWFVRKTTSGGRLLWHRDQQGWKHCQTATRVTDLAVGRGLLAMSVFDHGCCGDPYADGYALTLGLDGSPRWRAPFEPPGIWRGFYDQANGIAVGGFDNVYVVGWGATGKITREDMSPYPGVAAITKTSAGGSVLWTRRIPVAGSSDWPADVAVRGNDVMVIGDTKGIDIDWDGPPPSAWLVRLTPGGSIAWTRSWGERPRGADPVAVAIDPGGGTWVVGTSRDPGNRGLDTFIRRYASSGRLTWIRMMDGPLLNLGARDVAVTSDVLAIAAFAWNWTQDKYRGVVYRWAR